MGALFGTLTYKIFYVQDDLPEKWQDDFLASIRHRAFEPLSPESEDEEHYGWVPIDTPLRVEFDAHTVIFDHFINLGLRQDKYAIPSALLKAHIQQAEREYLVEHKKERLTKFEKEDIKAMVRKKLKERSLPKMGVTDMSWDLRSGRVRFWSQSKNTCELFQGLFTDTFGLNIVPSNPYILGTKMDLDDRQIEQLKTVEPCDFVG